MPNEWVELLKSAPDLVKEIYGDLAKPGAIQMGKALESIVGLGNTALFPIALVNAKARYALESNLGKYRERLKEVPIERVCEVPPEIGVPIIEKLAYVSDSDLSDLYVNLLAKASDSQTSSQAHPGFVNVIGNFAPDEAILLQQFENVQSLPLASAKFYNQKNEWSTVGDSVLTGLELKIPIKFPTNMSVYLSNYEGLGLVQARWDIRCIPLTVYEKLENLYRPRFEQLKPAFAVNGFTELKFDHGRLDVTPFGRLFVNACLRKK